MAKEEISLLCCEIAALLTDICKFLTEEMQNGTISDNGRALAGVLIERSKVQLKAIKKMTPTLDISDPVSESYVDMQGPKVIVTHDDPQEVYSDVTFEGTSNVSVIDDATQDDICPYDNLPATEVKEGKSGILFKKEKFLFFDQQRKVFAAIKQSWLLIYINEHAVKPCQIFDLVGYNALPSNTTIKEIKKLEESFNLCSLNDSKSYQFAALTAKDMLQWVSAINFQSELIQTKRSLLPIQTNTILTENTETFESDSSNEYEPLTEYHLKNDQISYNQHKLLNSTPNRIPLPLPPRNTPLKMLHSVERIPSEESMGDYDCVGPGPDDSFSDENVEDVFYDNPTELKQKSNYKSNKHMLDRPNINEDEDDEIYDYLQQPTQTSNNSWLIKNFTITTEDTTLQKLAENINKGGNPKERHKSTLKPKFLSFSRKRKNN